MMDVYYYTNDNEILLICSHIKIGDRVIGLPYSKFGTFIEKLKQIYQTVDYLCDEHDIIIFNLLK